MRFEDVLEIKNGRNQKAVENPGGQYPIYGSGGIMGYANDYICDAQTVIIGRKGNINSPIFVEEAFWNVDTAFGLSANRDVLLPRYLYYFCKKFDFKRLNKTVTIPSLTKSDLLKIEIDLPDLEKQHDVVDQLVKIERIITLRKQELEFLDELIKARFIEMFGDPIINSKHLETKELKDVLMLKAGDFTAASEISDDMSEINQYPCYGGNGVRGYVSKYNQDGEYSIIGRQGALSGNVQFASGKFKNTEHALLVTPIVEMNNIWLNQLLINLDLKRYQTGAAQPGLSVKNLQEIEIIYVPIDKQNQFASFVEQTNKSKSCNSSCFR
ncbi:hypothetical protein HMPREF0490_01208 [Lachnospiraceae bacterium 6_1_37FAA]|nr:hypothetical protein HMPREF0490_01208 [Lachnospiraceae bacterium 6_1_37FAA]